MTAVSTSTRLAFAHRVVDLSRPQVMGILNVTPDSFSDGGRFNRLDAALRHAQDMAQAGATFIDVGGESTRPGALPVAPAEELDRVAPVVEAIARELDVVVSVDTSSPEVMRESARLGAGFINDVRALRRPGALAAAAATGLPVCLMHMCGDPADMQKDPQYQDVCLAVQTFLREAVARCGAAGIPAERIVLDPGFGFAKTRQHNLQLLRQLERLVGMGRPLLVGLSRKSLIGQTLGRGPEQRLAGSLALAALALSKGARILRVHDVAETVDVVRMLEAVETAE